MVNDKYKYFVNKDSDDKAGILLNRASTFFTTMEANSYLEKLVRMWQFYHGVYNAGYEGNHQVSFTGEQGELVQIPVNHFRNLAQHIYVMITSNRPAMEARAVNTDYKSLSQTYLANNILDYYMREKKLEHYLKKATEMAIVLGSGFIKMEWNATAGRKQKPNDLEELEGEESLGGDLLLQSESLYDESEDLYDGEIEFSNLDPFNVVVDGTKETWDDMEWVLTRTWKNRFDLMAKYPEMAEQIKGIPEKNMADTYRLNMWSNDVTDDIPVYEFFHKRTEAVPQGNYMLFLDSDVVIMDRPLPYREIPIFRICPSEILGTPYGYTPMFDIYPIQESINSLYSTIMTNQNAFGVQNIWVKRGDELSLETYEGGLNLMVTDEPPKPLNLTETPKEIFEMLQNMIQAGEVISGVNSVARGNPQASLESGTALALVQSMALQFMSGLQQSYVHLIEDVGTALINILKDFVKSPKLIELVGKNNRPYLKEFVGEDIDAINRVIVDVGNPLARSVAGRVQIAEQLLQMKVLKTPEQYFQVLNTGRLDSTFKGEMGQLLLIQQENEELMEGRPVIATALDQHRLHILEHRTVIDDPSLRHNNPELIEAVQEHIQQHLDYLRETDPALLELLGEQPLGPVGGSPANQPGPEELAPPQGSVDQYMQELLGTPQQGAIQQGEEILTEGQGQVVPNLPGVPGEALPNPELQEQSLGNVK